MPLTTLSLERYARREGRTDITDVALAHLSAFRRLISVNLYGTHISDTGLNHLTQLGSLQHLDLSFTKVTDAGVYHLSRLRSLKRLLLGGTAVSDDALQDLRTALPDCEITASTRIGCTAEDIFGDDGD